MKSKTKLVIIFFVVLALGLILYLFLGRRQKPTVPQTVFSPIENPTFSQNEVGSIKYIGAKIDPPSMMGIYGNEGATLKDMANAISQQLGLNQSKFSDAVWISQDGKKSLSVDTFNNLIQYSEEASAIRGKGTKPTLNESTTRALEFLNSIGIGSNVSALPRQVYYLAGEELKEIKPQDAEVLEMQFEQKLEGFPLSVDIYTFSDITIFTSSENQVIKAIFPPKLAPKNKLKELNTITFTQAVAFVENNKGQIIEIKTREGRSVKAIALADLNLKSATLEYRLYQKENKFYPYYRFEGEGLIKETSEVAFVTIILPAINLSGN